MQNKKTYSLETLNNLKAEIIKSREERKKEITLDKLFLQSKKDILELIEIGCNAKDIANIYKKAGIQVGVAKIKKAYFTTVTKKKPIRQPKIDLSVNNQG